MVNYGNGFTWSEVYFMPIHWRRFYFKKLVESKKKENSVKQSKQELETIPEIKNINDRFNKTFRIDLNDRLAFIKNLFEGDTASYEKVLSQIVTFESWEEVFNFIDFQVKTEYDNWNKNEEIADRFLAILQKNFDR